MNRRGFLKAVGVTAGAAIIAPLSYAIPVPTTYTISYWRKQCSNAGPEPKWQHLSKVTDGYTTKYYLNGIQDPSAEDLFFNDNEYITNYMQTIA